MLFFFDVKQGITIDYKKFVDDINATEQIPLYIYTNDYYEIFKNIVVSLIHDKEICLLDFDFSEHEIKQLVGNASINSTLKVSRSDFRTFSEVIEKINKVKNWKLSLFTSGTTGLPKKISHTFASLTRNCNVSNHHKSDIWGYAYNPTHMAGIQVFFQALLNGNTIIRLFGLSRTEIFNQIEEHQITHLSSTPTFLRLLLPVDQHFDLVKRVTSGGEKFDVKLKDNIIKLFPNAKLLNVYASTEAGSIFASQEENFFITDSYKDLVKIKDSELYLHKSILGEGTEKKLDGDWYPTGDLIEILSESPLQFRFTSRKNEMINVGGYKVNPTEVEQIILAIEGVVDARVFGKANSILGNIICAEIVKNTPLEIADIRNYLDKYLQNFKIPRVINFVDNIEKTRTGKKKRS